MMHMRSGRMRPAKGGSIDHQVVVLARACNHAYSSWKFTMKNNSDRKHTWHSLRALIRCVGTKISVLSKRSQNWDAKSTRSRYCCHTRSDVGTSEVYHRAYAGTLMPDTDARRIAARSNDRASDLDCFTCKGNGELRREFGAFRGASRRLSSDTHSSSYTTECCMVASK